MLKTGIFLVGSNDVDGRFPADSRLLGLRPRPKKDNRGRPDEKGKDFAQVGYVGPNFSLVFAVRRQPLTVRRGWGLHIENRLGTPQEWMQQDEGWAPHPEEVRVLMAACRTLWFVRYFEKRQLGLKKYRPWYRLKQHPTQLDVISAAQEAFTREGVSAVPRFIQGTAEMPQGQQEDWQQAA